MRHNVASMTLRAITCRTPTGGMAMLASSIATMCALRSAGSRAAPPPAATALGGNGCAAAEEPATASSRPPVPPQQFEVLYECGSRQFHMLSTSPVTGDTVVVRCLVSNRSLPPLDEDAHAPRQSPGPRRDPTTKRLVQSSRRVAFPTYAPDALPIVFTAFVGSMERNMTMEAALSSLAGALCVDGVTMHPGHVRRDLVEMPLQAAAGRYHGPLMNQRGLAETIACPVRQCVHPLVPYRQHCRQFVDPFVNPRSASCGHFGHLPVHTAPAKVTSAVAAVLAEAGVDDEVALFVHRYAQYVQREEDALWAASICSVLNLQGANNQRQLGRS